MKTNWTPRLLQAFEQEIADAFNRGEIKSPVHLSGGNEEALLTIFKNIKPHDWVCSAWRSHYHCLLKGVPPWKLKDAIRAGRSIALCFPEHRVICSALVAGIAPIAVGLAQAAKGETVWCFLGDMTAHAGLTQECMRYASGHELPLRFVVEDNGKSVATDTELSWGKGNCLSYRCYQYQLTRPHVGTGQWVSM